MRIIWVKKYSLSVVGAAASIWKTAPSDKPVLFFVLRTNRIKFFPLCPAMQVFCGETEPSGNTSSKTAVSDQRLFKLCGSCFHCTYTVYMRYFISQYELYTDFSVEKSILCAELHKKQPSGVKIRQGQPWSVIFCQIPHTSPAYCYALRCTDCPKEKRRPSLLQVCLRSFCL